jgi:sentrin-specific protease 1
MAGPGKVYVDALFRYLQEDHQDKKGCPMPDTDQWTLQTCLRNETPQQFNGSDCGMFSLLFADFLSEDLPLSFDQQHIPAIRHKVCASIMAGKLWYCEDLWD